MKRRYLASHRRRGGVRRLVYLTVGLLIVVVLGIIWVHYLYNRDLQPVSNSQKTVVVTIAQGESVKQIAAQLQHQHLIRSAWGFELYVHSKELSDKLQAGTYAFSPSETTPAIVKTLTSGHVSTQLVTILPGRRIDQVRADLINDGFAPAAVDRALQPAQYADLPVLAYKPAGVDSLEGLLWPDSWYKDAGSQPSDIIRKSLTAMGQHLTSDIQAAFANENLTVYQGLTLASTVEQEVGKPSDQTQVAQVFLTRLKQGANLGSDAADLYGAIAAGKAPSINYDSPYNTRLHAGLPPTPISTVTASALTAAALPAKTNWLYFVTGDDGTTYFSTNLQDHQALTQKYCHKLCNP